MPRYGLSACLVSIVLCTGASGPAWAQDACEAPVDELSLSYDSFGRPLVPVSVDGREEVMLLDLGGGLSALEMDLVRRLGLPQIDSEIGMTVWTGETSYLATEVERFGLGAIELQDMSFMILPGYDYQLSAGERVGILALDFLADYDVAFDFASDAFRIYPSNACADLLGRDPDENAAILPILDATAHYISVSVFLDGIEFVGLLDTGAQNSVLDTDLAARFFGIDLSAPDDRMVLVDSFGAYRAYERRFNELRIGDIAIENPNFELFPNVLGDRRWETPDGEIIGPAQLIIGMDVLRGFHLYLAPQAALAVFTVAGEP
jgi:predicted aspartyl protease